MIVYIEGSHQIILFHVNLNYQNVRVAVANIYV